MFNPEKRETFFTIEINTQVFVYYSKHGRYYRKWYDLWKGNWGKTFRVSEIEFNYANTTRDMQKVIDHMVYVNDRVTFKP